MRPLAPAVFELRSIGISILACGVAGAMVAEPTDPAQARAGAAGLAGALVVLWLAGGARAARRAARLALPIRSRWRMEPGGATLARVLVSRTVPAVALAAAAAVLAAPYLEGAGAAVAGALLGAGIAALLSAQRVRAAEVVRGRRLLHEPHLLRPLGRSSLYLEPDALAERPGGSPPPGPWPSHRPPPRRQRSAIELEPSNGAALHGAGVRARPAGRVSAGAGPPDREPSAGG